MVLDPNPNPALIKSTRLNLPSLNGSVRIVCFYPVISKRMPCALGHVTAPRCRAFKDSALETAAFRCPSVLERSLSESSPRRSTSTTEDHLQVRHRFYRSARLTPVTTRTTESRGVLGSKVKTKF